jgi:ATP-dependent DNA helicase RecQ
MKDTPAMLQAREILKRQFGYDSFRMNQAAVIEAVLTGKDCVVLMPTGGGKSLCYQIPAIVMDGVTVVVSPLIALMKDQVEALRANGVNAAFLNSTQSTSQQVDVFRSVRSGDTKLLYVAPERVFQGGDQFLEFLRGLKISLFAIDEAHCISSWGHDFRPEYMRLAALKIEFPGVPMIALTATADTLVRKDIFDRLEIPKAELFISSFNRPNIFYAVEPKRRSFEQLIDFLEKRKDDSGIIYCLSRSSTDSLASDLRAEGYQALSYHAGLDKATRDKNQEAFLKDDAKIVVATIAFGMGIDKSNVRFVVHMDLPKNIESYYQETGRAGRDGLPSDALLFFSWGDVTKLKGFAEVEGNRTQSEIMLKKLDTMGKFGDLRTCRRKFLLTYFSEDFEGVCGNCDNCTTEVERFDGTVIAQKALSAVYRTDQRFGMAYIVDFLRGSRSEKIRDEHKNIRTYGVGADIAKENWFDYFKELIALGFLKQTDGQYPVLALTETSMDVLSGRTQVMLTKSRVREEKAARVAREVTYPHIPELFNDLRVLRTVIAREENVPPYVVFSDATLVEMATYLPQSEWEMKKISGVGELKFQRYGTDFLNEVRNYCSRNDLRSRIERRSPKRETRSRSTRPPRISDTYRQSLALHRAGKTMQEIAIERGLGLSTIEGHLARFVTAGEVKITELVSQKKIAAIREAIAKYGESGYLSPIKEALGEEYSFGEIRAVIAHIESEKAAKSAGV